MTNLIKSGLLAFFLVFSALAFAQDGTIYPLENPVEPGAILLGTGGVDNQPAPETWFRQWGDPMARNISTATLTPFLPEPGKANGAAVIVAPGGGFSWLSMGNEGWEVAEALAKQGIAAFVLKYRLNPTPPSLEDFSAWMNRPRPAAPAPPASGTSASATPAPRPPQRDLSNQLEDAEAAYAMIVNRAKEWGVDVNRIGMIGFSAGAITTMGAVMNEAASDRPNFAAPIYGAMDDKPPPAGAPPLFIAVTQDDPAVPATESLKIYASWTAAGLPAELHVYERGGHGFGMRTPARLRPAAAKDHAVFDDDAANGRVWPGTAKTPRGKAQGVGHMALVCLQIAHSSGEVVGRSSDTKRSKSSAAWKFL